MPPKPQIVRNRHPQPFLLDRLVGRVVQVAIGVGRLVVDRRRDDAEFDGFHAGNAFEPTGRSERVAGAALDGGDEELGGVVAEDLRTMGDDG